MLTFINNLTVKFSNIVTVQNMGQSYEGRKMVLVKLSTNPNGSNPIIFIDAGNLILSLAKLHFISKLYY